MTKKLWASLDMSVSEVVNASSECRVTKTSNRGNRPAISPRREPNAGDHPFRKGMQQMIGPGISPSHRLAWLPVSSWQQHRSRGIREYTNIRRYLLRCNIILQCTKYPMEVDSPASNSAGAVFSVNTGRQGRQTPAPRHRLPAESPHAPARIYAGRDDRRRCSCKGAARSASAHSHRSASSAASTARARNQNALGGPDGLAGNAHLAHDMLAVDPALLPGHVALHMFADLDGLVTAGVSSQSMPSSSNTRRVASP